MDSKNTRRASNRLRWSIAEQITGIPIETLVKVAQMIAQADGVCVCWAMGVTQHYIGSDTSTAISNLLLLTGNYMRPGAGPIHCAGIIMCRVPRTWVRARSASRVSVGGRSGSARPL